MGNKLISCLDPYQKIEGISKVGFIGFLHSFLGLISLGNLPFPAQGHTHLWHCFWLKSGREVRQPRDWETSCRQNEDSGSVKIEGQGSITPFSMPPKASPEGLFMTMPVLGHPSIEESYQLSLIDI